ncbi:MULTISPECIES: HD domain-containing phosphohydrolase [Anaerolinea]|uniref:HD domain-containing phosphohydrolase n=1 Tax=Anaerolinea TaxID=233189 RepID=UPI002616FB88|nr:HD domain-containing phosphohydrolase [Anaerolinea thermophila]
MISIRYRVLVATILLSGVLLFGLGWLENRQRAGFFQITEEQQRQLQSLFSQTIEQEQQTFQTLILDYTFWDELVDFVENPNEDWANHVLEPSSRVFQIDCLWIYSLENELVYQNQQPLCKQYAPHLLKPPGEFFQNQPYIKYTDWQTNVPAMSVYGASIHSSKDVAHQTPPHGYFFAGQTWDNEHLQHLSQLANLEITLKPPEGLGETMPFSETSLYVMYGLDGIDGSPKAYLIGKFDNPYISEFLKTQEQNRLFLFLLTVSFIGLVFATLSIWVIRPLGQLSSALKNHQVEALKPLLNETSEFGQIASHLYRFLQQKEEVEQALQQHKQIVQDLQESEERYRIITTYTRNFTFGIRVKDGQWTIGWGFEALQNLIPEIQPENFCEQISQFIHGSTHSSVEQIRSALQNGQQIFLEIKIPQNERKPLWYRFHLIPEIDENQQKLTRILGSAQNITGEKNAFEEYLNVLEQSNSAEIIADGSQILYCNSRVKHLLNREEPPTNLSDLLKLVHKEDQDKILSLLQNPKGTTDSESPIPIRLSPLDGVWRWLNLTIQPVLFENKTSIRISLLDITEKRNIELAMSAQAQYSDFLSKVFNAWILIFDASGNLLVSSKKWEDVLGNSESTSDIPFILSLFEFPDDAMTLEKFPQIVRDRQTFQDVPVLLYKAKPKRWFLWSHTFLEPQDDEPLRILAVLTEITEKKREEFYAQGVRKIAAEIQSESSLDEILQEIPQELVEQLKVDGAAWFTFQEDTRIYEAQHPHGVFRKVPILHAGTSLINTLQNIKESGETKIFPALDIFPDIDFARYHVIFLPTKIFLNNLQYFMALLVEPPIFPSLIEACEALCKMGAAIIERITSFVQANLRLQYMTSLHLISTSISASLDLNLTLRSLVNQIIGQFQVDAVAVFLVNPTTNMLEYAAGEGFRAIDIARTRLRIGEDQAGKAALTRKTVSIYNREGIASYFQRIHLFSYEEFVAFFAVPLIVQGEVKGVLETFHRRPFTPSQEWVQFLEALATETAIAINNAELIERVQRSHLELSIAYDATLTAWAKAVEWHENQPEGSTLQLAETVVRFAQFVGVNGTSLQYVRWGAILHDIGKLMIPRQILQKPGILNDTEWEIVRQSPVYAFNLLSTVPLLQSAAMIPYMHHENWDGSGYPLRLKGDEIPYSARIFSLVNVWDALRSPRPFRKAWSDEQVMAFLQENAGRMFDPDLVPAFIKFLNHRLQDKG